MTAARPVHFTSPVGVLAPLGRYSHLVSVPAGHRLLAIAGQTGHAADGSLPDTFAGQFRNALQNIVTILASEGAGPGELIKLSTFAVQQEFDVGLLAAARRDLLGEVKPVATFVFVAGLYLPELLVEIEAWAAVPS